MANAFFAYVGRKTLAAYQAVAPTFRTFYLEVLFTTVGFLSVVDVFMIFITALTGFAFTEVLLNSITLVDIGFALINLALLLVNRLRQVSIEEHWPSNSEIVEPSEENEGETTRTVVVSPSDDLCHQDQANQTNAVSDGGEIFHIELESESSSENEEIDNCETPTVTGSDESVTTVESTDTPRSESTSFTSLFRLTKRDLQIFFSLRLWFCLLFKHGFRGLKKAFWQQLLFTVYLLLLLAHLANYAHNRFLEESSGSSYHHYHHFRLVIILAEFASFTPVWLLRNGPSLGKGLIWVKILSRTAMEDWLGLFLGFIGDLVLLWRARFPRKDSTNDEPAQQQATSTLTTDDPNVTTSDSEVGNTDDSNLSDGVNPV